MNTIEHSQGRKNEELWNCLTMCANHAGVDEYANKAGMNKELNRHYAYKNILDEELRTNKLGSTYVQEKRYLSKKYEDVHR